VCKRFIFILQLEKQLYIPANPLLASFLKDIAETLSWTALQRFII